MMSCGQISAASSKEERAYAVAVSAFQDEMWSRAETQLAQFVKRYPSSTNVPQARLLQAQAEFKQQTYANAIGLLQTNLLAAGGLADQYVYWIGEMQFQSGDDSRAVAAFNSLVKNYPESPLRLRAVVGAASVFAKRSEWEQVIAVLEEKSGVFQRAWQLDPGDELVTRGALLLAQAKFALKDFGGASAVLDAINPPPASPALEWQRNYLLCQVKLADGDLNAALTASTNLFQALRRDRSGDSAVKQAESLALQAGILEKMDTPRRRWRSISKTSPTARRRKGSSRPS